MSVEQFLPEAEKPPIYSIALNVGDSEVIPYDLPAEIKYSDEVRLWLIQQVEKILKNPELSTGKGADSRLYDWAEPPRVFFSWVLGTLLNNNETITPNLLDELITTKPLKGLKVICVGGVELAPLALFGAEVTAIAPAFKDVENPYKQELGIQLIGKPLTTELLQTHQGQNVIMSLATMNVLAEGNIIENIEAFYDALRQFGQGRQFHAGDLVAEMRERLGVIKHAAYDVREGDPGSYTRFQYEVWQF